MTDGEGVHSPITIAALQVATYCPENAKETFVKRLTLFSGDVGISP